MAIVLLTARRIPTTGPVRCYLWRVHLDDSKTVPDPADPDAQIPDEAWVLEREFPAVPPRPMKVSEYVEEQRTEITLLAQHELARMQPKGRHLGGEGEEL
jgi:hypothetical protein